MRQTKTRSLILTGFFIALGLIIPYATSHAFGIEGRVFLPMHIPVLLCGLLLGWKYGVACGIITPILSNLITGMPPTYPMLPIMIVELALYGLVTGILYKNKKMSLFPSLIIAMLVGRIGANIVGQSLLLAGGNQLSPFKVVLVGLAVSIPGIIIQLVLIPILVKAVERGTFQVSEPKDKILNEAKDLIKSKQASCVVFSKAKVINYTDGRGVAPLINYYENSPELLKGNSVADKIIGKAAAVILDLAEVNYVYGELMSKAARSYLDEKKIEYSYGICVDVISNRDETGICPIEKSVLNENDPQKAYENIKLTLEKLKKAV